MKKRILVIGSLNMDMKSVPKREETDLILKEWKGDISLWQ